VGESPSQAQSTLRAITTALIAAYAEKPIRPNIAAPTLPNAPSGLRTWVTLALGLAAGLLASLIFTGIRRAPGRAALVAAATALVGVLWLLAPPQQSARATFRVDSPDVLDTIMRNLPVWLVPGERPGYTLTVEPDATQSGAQLVVRGPDLAQAQQRLYPALENLRRHISGEHWLEWKVQPLPHYECYLAQGCKVASFVLGTYEFEGIEPSVPNGLFAAALLISLTAALCALTVLPRRRIL
jgi:hypothetical protein